MDEPLTTDAGTATPEYDCIVISDLHLGSDVCQAKLLEAFSSEWAVLTSSRVLVINNGDIFDDLNFNRLTKRHFACLKVIRRNSDRDDFRLIWMRGNHDGPADIISHIVGVEILDEYVYRNDQIELLILHGDQFDTFITHYKWLTEISCGIFYYIQKWMLLIAARWILPDSWKPLAAQQHAADRCRLCDRIRDVSAWIRHVTCGHTHLPLTSVVDGIQYLNTGTWIESPPCPFVSVRGAQVSLEFWPLAVVDAPTSLIAEPPPVSRFPPSDKPPSACAGRTSPWKARPAHGSPVP